GGLVTGGTGGGSLLGGGLSLGGSASAGAGTSTSGGLGGLLGGLAGTH
ncbi:hypothetical protein IQK56_29530, partial [Pseudomonas sp. MAFF 301449]|nr:hypothetical protein [Pseudomonas cyclaminis]